MGTILNSANGLKCQHWSDLNGRFFNYMFVDNNVKSARNFCRNVNNGYQVPWCMTEEGVSFCDIPFCNEIALKHKECKPLEMVSEYEYSGRLSYTVEGYICQNWSVQTPHKHHEFNYQFPENSITAANNYCRFMKFEIGCFTIDPEVRWQRCLVPTCEHPPTSSTANCKTNRRGLQYMGTTNSTINMKVCWPWSLFRRRLMTIGRFFNESYDAAFNYCRNIDNDPIGPWCFNCKSNCGSKKFRTFEKGYCGIPICDVSTRQNELYKSHTVKSKMKTQMWIAADMILLTVCPACLLFGTISNGLSMLVFMSKKRRRLIVSFLLVVLAVFDSLSLYMGMIPRWLRRMTDWDLETSNDAICQLYNFVMGIVMSFPGWVLLTLSYVRYIAITKPFESNVICTKINASKWLSVILACLSLVNIPKALFSKAHYKIMFEFDELHFSVYRDCQISNHIAAWLDLFSRCVFPFIILLVNNIVTICSHYRHVQNRIEITNTTRKNETQNTKLLTIILLTATFSYLFLSLPYFIYILSTTVVTLTNRSVFNPLDLFNRYSDYKINPDEEDSGEKYSADVYFWFISAISFMYINNSINFYLYCISGRVLRHEFLLIIGWKNVKRSVTGDGR